MKPKNMLLLRICFIIWGIYVRAEDGYPPRWTKPEKMKRILFVQPMDSTVKLRCQAEGSPTPQILWYKDGIPVEKVIRLHGYPPIKTRLDKAQLVINQLMNSDSGNYTCVAINELGRIEHSFKVEATRQLNHVPILVDKSDNLTVMVGMPATFTCRFKTDLSTVIHWVRPISNPYDTTFNKSSPENYLSVKDSEGRGAIGENLVIPSTKLTDAGVYFCVGRTNYGMTPGVLHLSVLDANEAIYETPRNVTAVIGSTVTFSCRTQIDLHKHTSWIRMVDDEIKELSSETEVLTINNISDADAGIYACVVGKTPSRFEYAAHLTVVNATGGPFSVTPIASSFIETKHLRVIAGSVSMMMILFTCIILFVYRRLLREKKKRRQAPVQTLIKKVIIERDHASSGEASEITLPSVKILKQQSSFINSVNGLSSGRSRLGSENTTLTMISEYELPLDSDWEVPRSKIKLAETLGEGFFGKVVKAEVKDLPRQSGVVTTTAVKMLKEDHTDSDMIDLVSEMAMMKVIGQHVNIINLLGVCTRDGPLYVIVEYAEHGNLKEFLRKKSKAYTSEEGYERPNSIKDNQLNNNREIISEKQLISFARQVCKGMEYLGSMKCIHRDLAARNVLVAKDYVVKIADFGLARDIHADEYYKKRGNGHVPIKWMAPESLFKKIYTTKSDVWSFGVLLWEIMTLGANPYPSVPLLEDLFKHLERGYRMERPSACSKDVYAIMKECWTEDPTLRPTFTELIDRFDRILVFGREPDYLDMMSSNSKDYVFKECLPLPPTLEETLGPLASKELQFMYQNHFGVRPPPFTHINPTYANQSFFSSKEEEENEDEELDFNHYKDNFQNHFVSSAL